MRRAPPSCRRSVSVSAMCAHCRLARARQDKRPPQACRNANGRGALQTAFRRARPVLDTATETSGMPAALQSAVQRALRCSSLARQLWAAPPGQARLWRSRLPIQPTQGTPCSSGGGTAAARALHAAATTTGTQQAAAPPSDGPVVVVALGGNALLKRGQPLTMEVQQHK